MPIPEPRADETEDDFISRCISTLHDTDPDRPDDQITAMCYSAWRGQESSTEGLFESLHADFLKILNDFLRIFGKKEGTQRYTDMVAAYGLDTAKAYNVQVQLKECWGGICEAYNWAKPLIKYLKEDDEAKYYKVRALTASISMNQNDYTDLVELERSARTLTWRPLNLNHDPAKTLPFPENRVDWAEFEDDAVECIIRIHNSQPEIQQALEDGDIVNPSIEGEPRGGHRTADGRKVPKFYNFTALALLEKGVTLPGVPATYGFEPLFLNESLGRSLAESLSVENETEEEDMSETKKKIEDDNKVTASLEEKALKEAKGIYGMDVCGQCNSYQELSDTTETVPAVTGAESDTEVSKSQGAIGPGVGRCSITERLVRKNDSVCTDGRPRAQATDLDRTKETIGEMVMKDQINELEEKVLRANQARTQEISDHVKTKKDLTEAADKNSRITQDLAVEQSKNVRLRENVRDFTGKLETAMNLIPELEVRLKSATADVDFYKDANKNHEEKFAVQTKSLAEAKDEITRALTKMNEESTKRATAVQESINAEREKGRLVKEVAELTERIAELTREVSNSAQVRSETAKQNLNDQVLIKELREKDEEKTKTIRELKRRISKMPKEIVIE